MTELECDHYMSSAMKHENYVVEHGTDPKGEGREINCLIAEETYVHVYIHGNARLCTAH